MNPIFIYVCIDKKHLISICYPGLPIKCHINVKYLKCDAKASFADVCDMFKLMSVSGLSQS